MKKRERALTSIALILLAGIFLYLLHDVWITSNREDLVFESFRKLYFPLIVLYKIIGLAGCFMIGISAIFLSLIGIGLSAGKMRIFFVILLFYLLGPVFLFIWTEYIQPLFFK